MKKHCYCFACEAEFRVLYEGDDPIKFCPLCGESLEDADTDIEELEV